MDQMLFYEIYGSALDNLHIAFGHFKKSLNFELLKENIKRQSKLFEILIEGSFVYWNNKSFN